MKVTLSEIQKNLQENNFGVDEAKNPIDDLEEKEEKNIQPKQQEEPRIQQNKDSIRSLWNAPNVTNLNHRDARGEEKEQEIKNLFEKIMKENFPNLVKEIDMQVQEAWRIPNKMHAKRPTPRHIIIKMPKVKNKEMGGQVWENG